VPQNGVSKLGPDGRRRTLGTENWRLVTGVTGDWQMFLTIAVNRTTVSQNETLGFGVG
jgi:hypothetical protein